MRRSVVTHHRRRIKKSIIHDGSNLAGQAREDLRQIGLVQLSSIPFRPVTPKIGHPFALASQAVLREKLATF
jgi:hypothetical protein